jgi:hypothetical protein
LDEGRLASSCQLSLQAATLEFLHGPIPDLRKAEHDLEIITAVAIARRVVFGGKVKCLVA